MPLRKKRSRQCIKAGSKGEKSKAKLAVLNRKVSKSGMARSVDDEVAGNHDDANCMCVHLATDTGNDNDNIMGATNNGNSNDNGNESHEGQDHSNIIGDQLETNISDDGDEEMEENSMIGDDSSMEDDNVMCCRNCHRRKERGCAEEIQPALANIYGLNFRPVDITRNKCSYKFCTMR